MEKVPIVFENLLSRPIVVLFILSFIAFLIYSNTFYASFHFDDLSSIVENPKIKHLSNMLDLSGTRYVGFLTFALNYHFGMLNVFGYHLVNLLIHITNGFLIYLVIQLLFKTPRLQTWSSVSVGSPSHLTRASWIAFATALLFIAHPIQTQAVTYIVQRFASLATLFYLLTIVFYLRWRLAPRDEKHRFLWYAGAGISAILGMKTKEITFTLPFMLILIEVVFFGLLSRKRLLPLISFLILLPIIPLSIPSNEVAGIARLTDEISRLDYLTTQFRVIVSYLRLLVFPVNQNLEYEYPLYHSLLNPEVFLSFLFLFTLFLLSIYFLFSRRFKSLPLSLAGFGFLWFFLTLSIESSIIPLGRVIFEHRVYLPSVGFFMSVSTLIIGGLNRQRALAGFLVGAMALVFSIATYQRNMIWQNELTLWKDVVQKSPRTAIGYLNLGMAYISEGRLEEGISHLKVALTIDPDYVEAHNNLGLAYQKQGNLEEAILYYQKAIALNPRFASAYNNLGYIYQKKDHLEEALKTYQKALSIKPDFSHAYNNLGVVLKKMGRFDEALQAFQKALYFSPENIIPRMNLGNVYKNRGEMEEAIFEFQKALTIGPENPKPHDHLGMIYMKQGKHQKAFEHLRTATQKGSEDPHTFYNLGVIYYQQGNKTEGAKRFHQAVQLNRNYKKAYLNLAKIYLDEGQPEHAINAFREVVRISPEDYLSHYDLARLLEKKGSHKEAERHYRHFLKTVQLSTVSDEMIDEVQRKLNLKGQSGP